MKSTDSMQTKSYRVAGRMFLGPKFSTRISATDIDAAFGQVYTEKGGEPGSGSIVEIRIEEELFTIRRGVKIFLRVCSVVGLFLLFVGGVVADRFWNNLPNIDWHWIRWIDMESMMATLFCAFTHVLVVAAIVGMGVFIFHVIKDENVAIERLLRVVALAAGLLTYLAGKAYGIAIPALMANALDITKPFTLGIWGAVVPSMAGTFVAWFCLHLMKKNDDVGKRGLVLFTSFIITMFADSYSAIAAKLTPSQTALGLPNMTFVLGIILYLVFKYERPSQVR